MLHNLKERPTVDSAGQFGGLLLCVQVPSGQGTEADR
jgi:hypothetical protein